MEALSLSKQIPVPTFCGTPADLALRALERFHGRLSPGLILGALMADWAHELLGTDSDLKAVVESRRYLPDAVQLLTPCTVGNGRLIIRDWGKTALSLFDGKTSAGYRIWLDLKKTRPIRSIYAWHMRLATEPACPAEALISDILTAGRSLFSLRAIPITRPFDPPRKIVMAVCPTCGEAYPQAHGECCRSCAGNSYYEL